MIGTTLKLGFDGKAVDGGLKQTEKKVGNFSLNVGKMFKGGIAGGVGAAAGLGLVDILGKALTLPFDMSKEVADWSGELVDFSAQTDLSIGKIVKLQEALRLSGVEGADVSRIMSTLADNLYTAANEGGPTADALKRMGLNAAELQKMGLDEAFYTIGKRVAELNKTTDTEWKITNQLGEVESRLTTTKTKFEGLETAMGDIFGSKMGYKLQRFFKDFNGSMGQAENNVGGLAQTMDSGLAQKLDKFTDALGRFQTWKRSVATIGLEEIFRNKGVEGMPDKVFDFLNPERVRPLVQQLGNMVGRNLEAVLSQDLTKSFDDFTRNLGRTFGQGFKESLKLSVGDFLPAFGGGKPSASNSRTVAPLIEDTNTILSDIRKNTFTAVWS